MLLLLGLGGCGGGDTVQEALGYQQVGPDELAVIKRPPLIVPPDFNLRPPRPDDQQDDKDAASEAARQTLIGPSSSLDDGPASEATDARALLVGTAGDNGSADAEAAGQSSDGQSLLISRTNRVERNLDELIESRSENRVDSALLRRLLAWTPEANAEATAADEGEAAEGEAAAETPEAVVVQVVSREQTVISSPASTE